MNEHQSFLFLIYLKKILIFGRNEEDINTDKHGNSIESISSRSTNQIEPC